MMIRKPALFALFALLGMAAPQAMAADIAAGEKVFHKCRTCHEIGVGATNFYGPVLNGLIGRPAGSVPGYAYSDANKNSGKVWDAASVKEYLKKPKLDVPNTNMTFPGLKDETEIDNVIAFISQFERSGGKKAAQ